MFKTPRALIYKRKNVKHGVPKKMRRNLETEERNMCSERERKCKYITVVKGDNI
jgi:hypothetical protein